MMIQYTIEFRFFCKHDNPLSNERKAAHDVSSYCTARVRYEQTESSACHLTVLKTHQGAEYFRFSNNRLQIQSAVFYEFYLSRRQTKKCYLRHHDSLLRIATRETASVSTFPAKLITRHGEAGWRLMSCQIWACKCTKHQAINILSFSTKGEIETYVTFVRIFRVMI